MFWEEFRKQAVSAKFVEGGTIRALMRRAGIPEGSAFFKRMSEEFPTTRGDWRNIDNVDPLGLVSRINRQSKKDPGRTLDDVLETHYLSK